MEKLGFEYLVRRSARRKTLTITVYPDNRVVVSAPAICSRRSILLFVGKKSDWVRKTIEANLQKARCIQERRFQAGDKFLYLGREYILQILHGSPSQVTITDQDICVRLPVEEDLPASAGIKKLLFKWYQEQALSKVKEKISVYSALIGIKPRVVILKSLRSRWGSCSVHGRISLAWNIIMAPEQILDYLIVHELCHMVHHNHSAEYWNLVKSIIPDYREKNTWLRKNGNLLSFASERKFFD